MSWLDHGEALPQTFAVPPPPQVSGEVHDPQEVTVRLAPQLSFAVRLPQLAPRRVQKAASLSGVQPQVLVMPPPPQVSGEVQDPHELTVRFTPQLSVAV